MMVNWVGDPDGQMTALVSASADVGRVAFCQSVFVCSELSSPPGHSILSHFVHKSHSCYENDEWLWGPALGSIPLPYSGCVRTLAARFSFLWLCLDSVLGLVPHLYVTYL
jgi:hypothetical protein